MINVCHIPDKDIIERNQIPVCFFDVKDYDDYFVDENNKQLEGFNKRWAKKGKLLYADTCKIIYEANNLYVLSDSNCRVFQKLPFKIAYSCEFRPSFLCHPANHS